MAIKPRSGAGKKFTRKAGANNGATGGSLGMALGGAAALAAVSSITSALGLPSIPGLDVGSLLSNPLVLGAGAVALFILLK